jgi:hypothetical protein
MAAAKHGKEASGGHGKDDKPKVIIKKAKGHGGGHHGGAWKVAYADFVTAMMALFLVLWLLGASNTTQSVVAQYTANPAYSAARHHPPWRRRQVGVGCYPNPDFGNHA